MGVEVELQKAIYTVLNGAALGVTGVYDVAPQAEDGGASSAFPYVTIGMTVLTIEPVDEVQNFSGLTRVHSFSRTGSMLQCKTIQGAIYTALHNIDLTVTGFNCFSILRETSECFADQDGKIHGVCEYRTLLQTL